MKSDKRFCEIEYDEVWNASRPSSPKQYRSASLWHLGMLLNGWESGRENERDTDTEPADTRNLQHVSPLVTCECGEGREGGCAVPARCPTACDSGKMSTSYGTMLRLITVCRPPSHHDVSTALSLAPPDVLLLLSSGWGLCFHHSRHDVSF